MSTRYMPDNPFSGDDYYDKNQTSSTGINDSDKEPAERPVMYKKVKGFKIGYNEIRGVINNAFRWGQFIKNKVGMHPDEDDVIGVIFELEEGEGKREVVDYRVVDIRNRWDLRSSPDKYRFRCQIVDDSLVDDGYPRNVHIGSRTGHFYVKGEH